jgi:hypothetical protein
MPTYQICAVDDNGVNVVTTCDSATEAVAKLAGAAETHRRAWVADETGHDVTPDELMARALGERPKS